MEESAVFAALVLSFFLYYLIYIFVVNKYIAMVEFNNINEYYFLYQVDEIHFSNVQNCNVQLKVNNNIVFDEALSGDIGYNLLLRDIYSLLFPYFDITPDGIKLIELAIGLDGVFKNTKVLYSSRYIQSNYVVSTTNGGVLTSCSKRIIKPDDTDIIQFNLYSLPPELKLNVSLKTVYGKIDRIISVASGEKMEYNILEVLVSLKWLERNINSKDNSLYVSAEDIISFSIGVAELDPVLYFVDRSISNSVGRFLFVNDFGRIESVTIPGVVSRKVSVSSSRNVVANRLVVDNRKDSAEYFVETALMQPQIRQKIQQMFLSPKVWISGTEDDFEEIILSDITDEVLSDDGFIYSAKFKYRYTNILKI